MIDVSFTCPMCGDVWVETQNPNDDWFRLGTRQTLCARCAAKEIERIKSSKEWQEATYEILSRRSSGNK